MNELTQAEDRKGPGAEPQGIPKLKSLEEEEPATHFGVVSKAEGKTRREGSIVEAKTEVLQAGVTDDIQCC